jgi:hypothetical protein
LRTNEASAAVEEKNCRDEAISLLIGALDDTEERTGMSGSWNGKDFSNPRICDVAGHVLNQLDPKRFDFDLSASLRQRDRQRIAIHNAARKSQGLPLLPSPADRVAPVSAEIVQPLLAKLHRGTDVEREAAMNDLIKLGPGAFDQILAAVKGAPAGSEKAKTLERAARTMAGTVVELRFAEKSLKPTTEQTAQCQQFLNQPLDVQALTACVQKWCQQLKRPQHGFNLLLSRGYDGSGYTLQVDILDQVRAEQASRGSWTRADDTDPRDRPYVWNYNYHARVGNDSKSSTSGSGISIPREDLKKLLGYATEAAPDEPVEVHFQIIGVWRN